jgi:hypothetical protein
MTFSDTILEHYEENEGYIKDIGLDYNRNLSIITDDRTLLFEKFGKEIEAEKILVYDSDAAEKCDSCMLICDTSEVSFDKETGDCTCVYCETC